MSEEYTFYVFDAFQEKLMLRLRKTRFMKFESREIVTPILAPQKIEAVGFNVTCEKTIADLLDFMLEHLPMTREGRDRYNAFKSLIESPDKLKNHCIEEMPL